MAPTARDALKVYVERLLEIESGGVHRPDKSPQTPPEQPELLVFECSPSVSSQASDAVTQKGQFPPATTQHGGDSTMLRELLSKKVNQFLFIGHASGTHGMSLGFTSPMGGLTAVDSDELVHMLESKAPAAGGSLELVFINASHSAPLAEKLISAGIPAVVCWTTPVHNEAAMALMKAFFDHMQHAESDYAQVGRPCCICTPPVWAVPLAAPRSQVA